MKKKWFWIGLILILLIMILYKLGNNHKTEIDLNSNLQGAENISKEDVSLEYGNHYCVRSAPGEQSISNGFDGLMGPEDYKREDWWYDKDFVYIKHQNDLLQPYISNIEKLGYTKAYNHYVQYLMPCSMKFEIRLDSERQFPFENMNEEISNLHKLATYIDKSNIYIEQFSINYPSYDNHHYEGSFTSPSSNLHHMNLYINVKELSYAKTLKEQIDIVREHNSKFFLDNESQYLFKDMKKLENGNFTFGLNNSDWMYCSQTYGDWCQFYTVVIYYKPNLYYESSKTLADDIFSIKNEFIKNRITKPVQEQSYLKGIPSADEQTLHIIVVRNDGTKKPASVSFRWDDMTDTLTLYKAMDREFSNQINSPYAH